jgi:glycosyltransferase involved in cell wall biosynthesis
MPEALLLPTLFEACPLPILVAMASGCPIVTADRYGTKEMAGDAGILVNPESVESIAAGMVQILEDRPTRERLIQAGRERADRFSWPRCARETLDVLERAYQGHEPGVRSQPRVPATHEVPQL